MKKISLQWRLTIITSVFVTIICVILNILLYQNGVHHIESLENAVINYGGDENQMYIDIPQSEWDDFASGFSIQIYDTKKNYAVMGWIITAVVALIGGGLTYFVSGRALRPLREFSDKVEKVQAQNLTDCMVDEGGVPEFSKLCSSYNEMLLRVSDAFEVQRQFTGNAAHELRTPLALVQAQLDLYNATEHPGSDAETVETIKMVTEQNERLTKLVRTLLDMSEFQTVPRSEQVELDLLVEEVLADLEPLALERDIRLVHRSEGEAVLMGSDILLYRMVFNLVENAIKYNREGGSVTASAVKRGENIVITVADTGNGIAKEDRERIFEPFFRVDKSRSRSLGGVGLGLALVQEIVSLHKGTIAVRDNEGSGTIFEVQMPCT